MRYLPAAAVEAAERRRVVRGVVTGTVPDDLAREEQARISAELAQAQRVLATTGIVYGASRRP